MFFNVFIEIFVFLIACCVGLYFSRYFSKFYLLHLFQLLVYLIIYVESHIIKASQDIYPIFLVKKNLWVYNVYMPLELFILLWAAVVYANNKRITNLIVLAFACCIFSFIYETSSASFFEFASYSYLIGGITIVTAYIIILYLIIVEKRRNQAILPEFWICLGTILYFACITPYIAFFNSLQTNSPEVNKFLYRLITGLFTNVRYLMVAIGFWKYSKQKTSLNSLHNGK